jgi:hypothetical protein
MALSVLSRLWRLKWDNRHKEVYWRLALNGLPVAARMGNNKPGAPVPACGCGHRNPDRCHHYWECWVVEDVKHTINARLNTNYTITIQNLWLCEAPEGVHAGVWDVVCIAAIAAMDSARRRMDAARIDAKRQGLLRMPQDVPSQASRQATTRFWNLLQDYCTLATAPPEWQEQVTQGHPFFYWEPVDREWKLSLDQ